MTLFIDTSENDKLTFGLLEKGSFSSFQTSKLSEQILGLLERFLKHSRTKKHLLSKIAVVTGPGHFSRIRTGVTLANSLAFALGLKVVGIQKDLRPLNYQKIRESKGQDQVLPHYDSKPHITLNRAKV